MWNRYKDKHRKQEHLILFLSFVSLYFKTPFGIEVVPSTANELARLATEEAAHMNRATMSAMSGG